ncbi:hypothetical protein FJ955_12760 [Mesorhizobium sp. B2-2-2]|nr:hypothetical protein FJ955_12760 [Mesorhizobium sp. B2-2-2]
MQRIAEVLRAALAVGEIGDALQIPAAAVACRDRAKRLAGLADDVITVTQFVVPQIARARRIHGEVAGIVNGSCADFLQVKRSGPLQDHS